MKNFWIFATVFYLGHSFIHQLLAQSDTLHFYQAYSSFSNTEKAEWTSFENNWNYFEYNKIQKNYKVSKLNCKNCTSFYADVYLEIDDAGKVTHVRFIKGKKCGISCNEELFIGLFENSLKKQHFVYLKNKRFIARFGHVLKC
ncbi:MAG: hypothetical protein H7141_03190 [Burkholderiales bacterium]|nr:hypothetical protein [Bacteroidia bacterium]